MQMQMPRVLILCFVAQILLLVTADEEEAKREAIKFAIKAVRLSFMALPSVRDARTPYPTSSVSTAGGSPGHRWIMNVYMGNYSDAIADLDTHTIVNVNKPPTSIIEEIPKAMAMASPAADVDGPSHSKNTKHGNSPSAAALFKEPIKKITEVDREPEVGKKVEHIATHIDSVIDSDEFFLNKLSKDHTNVKADELHDLKMLFLYGCFYSNLKGQLETVGLKANMNLTEADKKLASDTAVQTDKVKYLRANFMPYWLGIVQQKLMAQISSKMAQIKGHNDNNGQQKDPKFLEKAKNLAKNIPFVGHLFIEEHAILKELNQCKGGHTKNADHKEQKHHHKTATDEESGKREV